MSDNMTLPGPEPPARTSGLIAALGCGILMLVPGGCFLLVAGGAIFGPISHGPGAVDWLLTGIFILAVLGLLIWAAVRRRRPAGTGLPPSTLQDPE